jgi:hypothetical protein
MITEEQFQAYVELQQSGLQNMMNTQGVQNLTKLTKEEQTEIRENYEKLSDQYPEVADAD